VHREGTRLR